MNNKITLKFGILLIILLTAFGAEAAVKLRGLNFMEDVVTETTGNESFYNIEFTKPIKHFNGPDFFKKSIQIDFPNAYIDPAKQTYSINDSVISEVFVAQIDPKTVRLRFVLENENIDLRDQFQIQKAGRFLNINIGNGQPIDSNYENYAMVETVDNNINERDFVKETPRNTEYSYDSPIVNKAPKTKVQPSSYEISKNLETPSPNEDELDDLLKEIDQAKKTLAASDSFTSNGPVLTKPAVERQSEEPGDSVEQVADISYTDQLKSIISRKDPLAENSRPKKQVTLQQSDASNKALSFLDYDGDLTKGSAPGLPETAGKMVSSLALVLGIMFLVFTLFKKFVLKNGLMGGNTQTIKVIGTGIIGPRKSVSLVEVAGEILVLGISNDNISLLSKVEDEEKIEELKTAPNATISSAWKNVKKEKPKPIAVVPEKKPTKKVDNQAFANYVRQFSKEKSDPKPSISKAANAIQKNLGKLRTA